MMLLIPLLMASAVLAAPVSGASIDAAHAAAPHVALVQPDSADQLLRAGNDALARGDNARAAEIFARLAERYPRTKSGNDAHYFQALALYRTGDTPQLREARGALDALRNVDDRTLRGDALALDTRICGELARRGDERCARTVTTRAEGSIDLSGMVGDIVRATTTATADALSSAELQSAIASAGAIARAGVDEGMRAASDAMRSTSDALRESAMSLRATTPPRRGRASAECEKDQDNDVAQIALNAVTQMDADRAMPLLKKVMARRDKCSELLRQTAVMLIARKNAPEAADMLIDAARNDPDAEVRQQAVFWLSRVNGDRATGFLRDVATKPGDAEVRKQALYALSRSTVPAAREAMRQVATNDADEEVRSQAIFWLGQQGTADDIDFLKGLYPKLTSRNAKEQLLSTIARRKGNADWLLNVALDPKESNENRTQALFWAGQGGAPIEQMIGLYDKTNDHDMKESLINVYQRRGAGPAFDKLLDIARTEKDMDLRRSAFFWISRSKDPRAQKLVEDLIAGKP